MNIDTLVLGSLKANCYILSIGCKCLIIDPGEEENKIINHIRKEGFTPVGILVTHNHSDHNKSVSILCEMYDIKCYDYNTLFEQTHFLEPFKFKDVKVKVQFEGGKWYGKAGVVDFVDNQIDKNSVSKKNGIIFHESIVRKINPFITSGYLEDRSERYSTCNNLINAFINS